MKAFLRGLLGRTHIQEDIMKNKWPLDKLVSGAMKGYENAHGCSFDINNPELFTEKIIWYKLFWDRKGLVNVVDKYLFKDYLASKVGNEYVVPLIGAWTTAKDFFNDWDNLPESFCLKSTLKSDSQYIKIIKSKNVINLKKLKKEVNEWFNPQNTLINSYCRAYYEATPRIIAEELISGLSEQLYDYKIFCFDGKPEFVYSYANRFENENNAAMDDYSISIYDTKWKKIDAHIGGKPNIDVPKPKHFDKMIELATKLSEGFPFVRVDFYETEKNIYVGEMTLYPSGGLLKYEPKEFDKYLGDLFQLPYHESVQNKKYENANE